MKKIISPVLMLALLLPLISVLLSSCGEKQVPIYRGMTLPQLHNAKSAVATTDDENGIILLSDSGASDDDGADRYAWYAGDYVGRDEAINGEDPFPGGTASADLEERLLAEFDASSTSQPGIFFPTPTPDSFESLFSIANVNIHIENPDNLEIVSVTLNDRLYTSDMFEAGSSRKNIFIKPPYTVSADGSTVTFSLSLRISNIKYLDGDEIKDVILAGDTTLEHTEKSNRVDAHVSNVNIGATSLSFVADIDNGTSLSIGKENLKAVLYDGDRIVASQDLRTQEDNPVSFEGLEENTLYQYLIVGYYADPNSTAHINTKKIHVLYRSAFYTDSAVLFRDVTIGESSISFGYLWDEEHQGGEITALRLYKGDEYIKDIDAVATSVDGLLAGTCYKLVAEYLDGDTAKSIYLEFATPADAPLGAYMTSHAYIN